MLTNYVGHTAVMEGYRSSCILLSSETESQFRQGAVEQLTSLNDTRYEHTARSRDACPIRIVGT
jgi:hypothetical protein